jgi:hypothetical protein
VSAVQTGREGEMGRHHIKQWYPSSFQVFHLIVLSKLDGAHPVPRHTMLDFGVPCTPVKQGGFDGAALQRQMLVYHLEEVNQLPNVVSGCRSGLSFWKGSRVKMRGRPLRQGLPF